MLGLRGDFTENWSYDASFQYGETNRDSGARGLHEPHELRATRCRRPNGVTCANGDATCVPINVFGGFGAITPAMAAYSCATAHPGAGLRAADRPAFVTGSFESAAAPLGVRARSRSASASSIATSRAQLTPDECLKLAPTSCLGGAGGYLLPIDGGYKVNEAFMEALVPLVDGKTGAQGLDLEFGYRYSDYNAVGLATTPGRQG